MGGSDPDIPGGVVEVRQLPDCTGEGFSCRQIVNMHPISIYYS